MQSILDNSSLIAERDPKGALGIAASMWEQLQLELPVSGAVAPSDDITAIVVAGMGGSALAAGVLRDWLDLPVPFTVVRDYTLPNYVGSNTLVVASSYSGNTEETLQGLDDAERRGATIAVIAAGGQLMARADESDYARVTLPDGLQPRMAVFAGMVALTNILDAHGFQLDGARRELRDSAYWLQSQIKKWAPSVTATDNVAKQLAWKSSGKVIECIASRRFAAVAYDWKISFNENAKTVAFANELPEFNHNEFIGWSSHPIEKPFAVIDLRSSYDHPRIDRRFALTDKLLSGLRPKAMTVELQGEHMVQQMLWGMALASFVSIYLALLNGVEPMQVELVEKLKRELAD